MSDKDVRLSEDRVGQVVKIQLPISTTEEIPQMLVYNEDKSIYIMTPVQERYAKELKQSYKGYYEAVVTGDVIDIGKRVEDQPW